MLKTEDFIKKSISIHGPKYNYSLVKCCGLRKHVTIICPIHGEFLQYPYKHLMGRGCQSCGGSKKMGKINFIEKSNSIHGCVYGYDDVIYKNNATKVKILCHHHGIFEQRPQDHIKGQGCPKCVGKNKTTEEFVKKANIIHNNKYDYSKTIYKSAKKKVVIICPIHGDFNQIPDGHVNGKKGCPKCHSIISKQEEDFLNSVGVSVRQTKISKMKVDGFDPKTNTVYEFLGDYWHGNPNIFHPNKINYHCNKTFKRLYDETFSRFYKLKKLGYNIKYIWENDWELWCKNKIDPIPVKSF